MSALPSHYLTMNQFAEHFQVSHGTIKNWIREGRLKRVKFNKTVRIPRSEFDRMKTLAK